MQELLQVVYSEDTVR